MRIFFWFKLVENSPQPGPLATSPFSASISIFAELFNYKFLNIFFLIINLLFYSRVLERKFFQLVSSCDKNKSDKKRFTYSLNIASS